MARETINATTHRTKTIRLQSFSGITAVRLVFIFPDDDGDGGVEEGEWSPVWSAEQKTRNIGVKDLFALANCKGCYAPHSTLLRRMAAEYPTCVLMFPWRRRRVLQLAESMNNQPTIIPPYLIHTLVNISIPLFLMLLLTHKLHSAV